MLHKPQMLNYSSRSLNDPLGFASRIIGGKCQTSSPDSFSPYHVLRAKNKCPPVVIWPSGETQVGFPDPVMQGDRSAWVVYWISVIAKRHRRIKSGANYLRRKNFLPDH